MKTLFGDLIQTQLGSEIFIAVTSLFVFVLILWIMSNVFEFKKKDFSTAFMVSAMVVAVSFVIRLIGVFMFKQPQTIILKTVSILVEPFLLLILTKTAYSKRWGKPVLVSFGAYVLKWTAVGLLTVIIGLLFTDIPQKFQENQKWQDINTAQSIVSFRIAAPTYIPVGYRLMSIKPPTDSGQYVNDMVVLSYGEGGSVVSLHEQLRKYPPDFSNDFQPGGEPILINGNQGLMYEHRGPRNGPYLLWYSEDKNLLFFVFDSIGNQLIKEDLIRIASSIT